jgi:DNA-binding winged helix-turn-helix (wHTH) protein/serine/threonine protein kinase/tetratricopeptide (TPR) repeat protein
VTSAPNPSDKNQELTGRVWHFADCEFDEPGRELRVRGRAVELEAKPLELLHQLLLHPGEVLTKDELFEAVWPGLTVVEGSLTTAISKLRKALGNGDRIVVTVPRIGYRLNVPVHSTAPTVRLAAGLRVKPGDPVPGRDQWQLTRRLDTSPSSEVWLAEHRRSREVRVFKFASDEMQLKGLKREVTLARLLRESLGARPEFIRLLEWNFDALPYFLEFEYGGPNLAEWAIERGGLAEVPLSLRLRLVIDIARAVAAAHEVGVLHKDLKPGNILVTPGRGGDWQIRIADFGCASLLDPARLAALGITNQGFTQTAGPDGSLTGTMMYVAPEVLAGQSPTAAADVYALGVLLYQIVAGDFRKPIAPGWEAGIADPLIREDIADAACGDPARRIPSAEELAERLSGLERRTLERVRLEEKGIAVVQPRPATRRPWQLLLAAAVTVFVFALLGTALWRRFSPPVSHVKAIAVLPFQNSGSDASLDFLRLALPDEIAATLGHIPGVAVRPVAASSRYDPAALDLQRAAREMGVNTVVTGRFARAGQQLHIALELIDVGSNRVIWRDNVDAPGQSLIAMHVQIALRIRGGFARALGVSAGDTGSQPRNEEGYRLFLQSTVLPFEGDLNFKALGMLERSVELDPAYAPAWFALARRHYAHRRFASGTAESDKRFEAAAERALSLDRDYVPAAAGLIIERTERGDLVKNYREADALVRKRPDSVDAHFALSYVLRYAGLLKEAAKHCETALLLDSRAQTSGLVRSCAIVFILLGDYPRALNYLQADPSSDLTKAFTLDMLMREGRETEALRIGAPRTPEWKSYDLLLACVERRPPAEISALAAAVRPLEDPEWNYFAASHLAWCGQTAVALEMLNRAIGGGYCSYPSIEADPLFRNLRRLPEYEEIRSSGAACQQRFLTERGR